VEAPASVFIGVLVDMTFWEKENEEEKDRVE